jgi:hypothetical protein
MNHVLYQARTGGVECVYVGSKQGAIRANYFNLNLHERVEIPVNGLICSLYNLVCCLYS